MTFGGGDTSLGGKGYVRWEAPDGRGGIWRSARAFWEGFRGRRVVGEMGGRWELVKSMRKKSSGERKMRESGG